MHLGRRQKSRHSEDISIPGSIYVCTAPCQSLTQKQQQKKTRQRRSPVAAGNKSCRRAQCGVGAVPVSSLTRQLSVMRQQRAAARRPAEQARLVYIVPANRSIALGKASDRGDSARQKTDRRTDNFIAVLLFRRRGVGVSPIILLVCAKRGRARRAVKKEISNSSIVDL